MFGMPLCEWGYMHISALSRTKLDELKRAAISGDLSVKERKQRSDAGAGYLESFRGAFDNLICKMGEAMPHLTTSRPEIAGKYLFGCRRTIFDAYLT